MRREKLFFWKFGSFQGQLITKCFLLAKIPGSRTNARARADRPTAQHIMSGRDMDTFDDHDGSMNWDDAIASMNESDVMAVAELGAAAQPNTDSIWESDDAYSGEGNLFVADGAGNTGACRDGLRHGHGRLHLSESGEYVSPWPSPFGVEAYSGGAAADGGIADTADSIYNFDFAAKQAGAAQRAADDEAAFSAFVQRPAGTSGSASGMGSAPDALTWRAETPARSASTSAGYDGERCQGAIEGVTYHQLQQPSNGTRGNNMCLVPHCAHVFQPRGAGQGRYSRYNVRQPDRAAVVRRLSTMFKPDLWIEQAPDVPGGHEYKQLSAKERVIQTSTGCVHILPHNQWQSRLCPYHSGLAVDESAATNLPIALPIAFATGYPNVTPLLNRHSPAADVPTRAVSLAVPMACAPAVPMACAPDFTAASSTPAAFTPGTVAFTPTPAPPTAPSQSYATGGFGGGGVFGGGFDAGFGQAPALPAPARPFAAGGFGGGGGFDGGFDAGFGQPSAPAPAPAAPAPTPAKPAAEAPLPEGWMATKAPDGRVYYFHAATKKTSWTRPVAEPAPPAPAPAMDPSVIVKVQDLEGQKKLAVKAEERHATRARRLALDACRHASRLRPTCALPRGLVMLLSVLSLSLRRPQDYKEAKRLKALIDELKALGHQLADLERKKVCRSTPSINPPRKAHVLSRFDLLSC
jgi:hypothetical protein